MCGGTRRDTIVWLGMVALCIILFIALGAIVESGRTLAFDERVHRAVRGSVPTEFEEDDTSLRTRFMHLGPDIGTATVVFAPLTGLALIGLHRRPTAVLVLCSTFGALIVTMILKGLFHRTRSSEGCCFSAWHLFGYLFPSTHTVMTVVTYGLIACLLGAALRGWQRAFAIVFVLMVIGFVAVSLVYLNTHYVTDVVGGLLFGAAWLIGSLQILRIIEPPVGAWEGAQHAFPPGRAS